MLPLLLFLVFIVVPLAELYVIIQIGQLIGVLPTIALLLLDSILGAMLMRSQGRAVWRRFTEALQAGRPPAREVLDGALVLIGGAFLLTPGFLSDVLGALLLLPPSRALARRVLTRRFQHRDARVLRRARDRRRPRPRARRRLRRRRHGPRRRARPGPAPRRPPPAVTDRALESARPSTGEGFADAVTVSFADDARDWYGMVRLGLAGDGQGSALAVLFHAREPVAALAQGGLEFPAGADWADLALGGLRMTTGAPLERWTVAWEGTGHALDLELEAISAPAELDAGDPVAALGGMAGYDQLVAVRGRVRAGDHDVALDGLGQRGHAWGVADWSRLALTRTVGVWLGEEHGGAALTALRPEGAAGHDEEVVWAALVERGEPAICEDPRLSTTYDGDGHQRRAGLELWVSDEDGYPFRAAGEVICGSSFDLGALRLDLAFLRWHAEGASGVGRYDILRKA